MDDATRGDLDRLMGTLVALSLDFLRKRGEFAPHGAVLGSDDDVAFVSADGDDAHEMIAAMREGVAEKAADGEVRAAGIAMDVALPADGDAPTDAIRIDLDHVDSDALTIVVPYGRDEAGEIALGEPEAFESQDPIFD